MKKTAVVLISIVVAIAFIVMAEGGDDIPKYPYSDLYSSLEISPAPDSLGEEYADRFNRYAKVTAPNGKPIHIVAQGNISNEQILRVKGILEHYLRDFPNSQYGHDKTAVANKMADNNAVLLLLNGGDEDADMDVDGQPLYENEIQVEGHEWYMNQNYEHRDATFEEVLHLVHDYGIGVDGEYSFPGALDEYQAEIRAAQENALNNNLWGNEEYNDWPEELAAGNSLSQEYLAALIDAYYGLWGAWPDNSRRSMWGIYIAKTREEISVEDPQGWRLPDKFFHSYLTYNARIDPDFDGLFSLRFNPSLSYTNHAQYLKDITLLGDNNINVVIGEWDNDITGNDGINTIIFSGRHNEYDITNASRVMTVGDNVANRDGINTLTKVNVLRFADKEIVL